MDKRLEELDKQLEYHKMKLVRLGRELAPPLCVNDMLNCKNCDSRINTRMLKKYISTLKCPVCGAEMFSPKAAEVLNKERDTIKQLVNEIKVVEADVKRNQSRVS